MLALGGLLILVLTVNIYFIRIIVESSPSKDIMKNSPNFEPRINEAEVSTKPKENIRRSQKSITRDMEEKIKAEMRTLPSKYFKQNISYAILLDRLLIELRTMPNVRDDLWNIPNNNVNIFLYSFQNENTNKERRNESKKKIVLLGKMK